MAYSALFNNVLSSKLTFKKLLYLFSRNSASWQWHLVPLQNTEFCAIAAHVPYRSLSSKNTGKEGDCKSNSITSQWMRCS
jgi:hypothetical protein